MNVPIITMDPKAAEAKLEAYRNYLRRRADTEYEAAVLGYQALAEGTPLINLTDAFSAAGLNEAKLPRLAIARADRRQVTLSISRDALRFSTLRRPRWGYSGSLMISVPFSHPEKELWRYSDKYALIPMVPADVRPSGNLRDFFILWEVERWSDRPLLAVPDYDPYLLRHIVGDLYAVVAEWDLTELERAVMTGRREG